MFALTILLLLWTAAPARAQRSAPPTVVIQSQPRPQPESQKADAGEVEAGDKAVVRFEGLRAVGEKDVRKALREGRVNVEKPFVYDPAKIENAARVLKEYLASEGYLHAAVVVREDRVSTPYVVTLSVDEGELARIADFRFEGNKAVPGARLVAVARDCLDRLAGHAEQERGLYKPDRVDYCLRRPVWQLLRSEGYLQAQVGEHRIEETDTGVRVVAPVEERTRYRLGRVRVKGTNVFLPEQLVEMLELKAGDIADGGKLSRWVDERMRDEYGARGYVQYEYDIEPVYRPPAKGKDEGVVDFKVDVYEGKPFTISSITFKGNRLKTADELKSELSLREGDVFDRRKLREGLARLGRMGVYRGYSEIYGSNEADVGITLDEEKGLVSLRVFIVETDPR